MRMNDATFLKRVREIAQEDSLVVLTQHAKRRLRQRHITRLDVIKCLLRGAVIEPASPSITGDWTAKIGYRMAGESINVVVAITLGHRGEYILVITAME